MPIWFSSYLQNEFVPHLRVLSPDCNSADLSSKYKCHVSLLTSFIRQQRCNVSAVFNCKLWNHSTSHVRILQIKYIKCTSIQ